MNNTTKAALRMTALAAMVAVSGMMAGCTDDDDGGPDGTGSGGGGGGIPGSADISTPEGARAAAGTLLLVTDLATGLEDGSLLPVPAGAARSAKAVQNCDSGNFEDSSAANTDVKSPFNKTVDLSRVTYNKCKNVDGSEAGELTVTLDGVSESGESATGGPVVSYFRLGKGSSPTATTPFTFQYSLLATEGQAKGSGFTGTYGFFYRFDGAEAEDSSVEDRLVFDMNVKFKVQPPSGVPAGSIPEITYKAFFGTTENPFVVKETNSGVDIAGSYGASLSVPGNADSGCSNGGVKVTTKSPLARAATPQISPFTSGELELESNGKKAKVVFSGDKVLITPPDGAETEVTGAALRAAGNACAGLALSGLLLAGAAQ
jgi:hypothetical protein